MSARKTVSKMNAATLATDNEAKKRAASASDDEEEDADDEESKLRATAKRRATTGKDLNSAASCDEDDDEEAKPRATTKKKATAGKSASASEDDPSFRGPIEALPLDLPRKENVESETARTGELFPTLIPTEDPLLVMLSEVQDKLKQGSFLLSGESHTEEEIVLRLRMLRDENVPTEIDFCVGDILWTGRIIHEIIRTFEHYNDSGRRWNYAWFNNLQTATSFHVHIHLQTPVITQLFRNLSFRDEGSEYFRDEGSEYRPMGIELADSLAFILRNGRHVDRISIDGFEIGLDAMSVLSGGLVTVDGSVSPQKLFFDVQLSNDKESMYESRSAEQCLADGLARNKTLSEFVFRCDVDDYTCALIVLSLIGHQSLKKLELSRVEFGKSTIIGICGLLASPTCKLSSLEISHDAFEFDYQRFTELLPVNTSLEYLSFTTTDEDGANQLLRSLWKLPSLNILGLCSSMIGDFVRLANNVTATTPHSCLRHLDLWGHDFEFGEQSMSEEDPTVRSILHLLDVFPELGYVGFGSRSLKKFHNSIQERLDLNQCSGTLLRGGAAIPLSAWAVVLAKVNMENCQNTRTPARKANVLYHMLHGPVFAGRVPLGL